MQRPHRNAHRILWLILAPLICATLIYAATHRPVWHDSGDSLSSEESNGNQKQDLNHNHTPQTELKDQ